ncbi:MAG: DUF327 domain-containing protein [Armatimonadetes bacterium CG07_land_8_20_14_0_80_40_9]|nr:MAG: DUF327 domain-containing protein [Armatimonadetes bacterium CG07_land_8_20_14_0_80_40_9]
MKIKKVQSQLTKSAPLLDKETKPSTSKVAHLSFDKQLEDLKKEKWKERLNSFLTSIDKQGEKLVKTFSFEELERYKDKVREFMQEVVGRTYQVKEERSWDKRGRQKIYNTVLKVNQSLEELTEIVLNKQAEQLKILAKLDEIRGMLVDMYS